MSGSNLPFPSIKGGSSNRDVRDFLINYLQWIEANIDATEATNLAEKFTGAGDQFLASDQAVWTEIYGASKGALVYQEVVRMRRDMRREMADQYVDVSLKHFKLDDYTNKY